MINILIFAFILSDTKNIAQKLTDINFCAHLNGRARICPSSIQCHLTLRVHFVANIANRTWVLETNLPGLERKSKHRENLHPEPKSKPLEERLIFDQTTGGPREHWSRAMPLCAKHLYQRGVRWQKWRPFVCLFSCCAIWKSQVILSFSLRYPSIVRLSRHTEKSQPGALSLFSLSASVLIAGRKQTLVKLHVIRHRQSWDNDARRRSQRSPTPR